MTGEMRREEVTPEAYPIHFAIAKEFGGTVEPFDHYQGPYVVIGGDVRLGDEPYAVAVQGLGVVRLWLCTDDGAFGSIYNEANEAQSDEFPLYTRDPEEAKRYAIDAAREVLFTQEFAKTDRPTYYTCGICEFYHSAHWNGDCRENGARFYAEDLDAKHGRDGWDEIRMRDVGAFQKAQNIKIGPEDFAGKSY